jgi:hypothetical protein
VEKHATSLDFDGLPKPQDDLSFPVSFRDHSKYLVLAWLWELTKRPQNNPN